ncbi:MAG: nucleoside transporter [Candidatus Marinimicrobia bacterium]|nr:nucleoside transporter [Candidatus Neomarinimicrobiota bacterium]
MQYLINVIGIIILMGIAWSLSNNRKVVNWQVIGWGIGLQLIFALFVFVIPIGSRFFLLINDLVMAVLDSAFAGTFFVFGPLAVGPGATGPGGATSLGFILITQALPTIIFFAALMGVLYHVGVMNRIIQGFSWLFTRLMKISGAESLSASTNIFVGIESALVIRPHLIKMTKSELTTILTAGMATVASSMLAVYVFMLRDQFPTIAAHLVSASIMNAPAAIIMSKLIYPETETPETLGLHVKPEYKKDPNLISAVISSATAGARLIIGIVTLLLAFLGLVALADKILVLFGSQINTLFGIGIDWTLKGLLGYLFYPVTLLLGIPFQDAAVVSKIIGSRAIVTEVAAFQNLAAVLQSNVVLEPRTVVITTYALTGFAHIASLAIFVGGIAALVPERLNDLSRLGFRALLAATLATLLTAAVAGLFYNPNSVLLNL